MMAKKRFYKTVGIAEEQDGLAILLDGRGVRSPAGTAMRLPGHALASAVAAEWDAQTEEIDPASMPIFSLAVTVIDRVTPQMLGVFCISLGDDQLRRIDRKG